MTPTNGSALPPTASYLAYSRARGAMGSHPLRASEIPVEHAISLPVPTNRFAGPGYAWFAGPARRAPHQPPTLSAPDRWWVVDARRGRLAAYNLVAAVPFGEAPLTGPVSLPPAGRDVPALAADLALLDQLMDRTVERFFGNEAPDPVVAEDLRAVFAGYVSPAVLDWYSALAPDFFDWLTSAEVAR